MFQFDTGQITRDHTCITLVEINDKKTIVNTYENLENTSPAMITGQVENATAIFRQTLVPERIDKYQTDKEMVPGDSDSGACFIGSTGFNS